MVIPEKNKLVEGTTMFWAQRIIPERNKLSEGSTMFWAQRKYFS